MGMMLCGGLMCRMIRNCGQQEKRTSCCTFVPANDADGGEIDQAMKTIGQTPTTRTDLGRRRLVELGSGRGMEDDDPSCRRVIGRSTWIAPDLQLLRCTPDKRTDI
ncbi:hypothetical protein SKAU_G00273440 [Synaphobranchus kaupii]|uniref:Uncharacterized protein n=1 Tax=Synaphobranchus kaupii TaxID=118154 RepID=A0A9Q1F0Z2_SYNKA|nr:hypothetical protein SKAU_G00273440 [Synaphobranchus kaupii]